MIPIQRELRSIVEDIPHDAVTILANSEGRPWQGGFVSSFRKGRTPLIRKLGLVFPGLRKTSVVTLLEAGCTDAEVSAITGQTRDMVAHYARQVNQTKLARAAINKWELGNGNCQTDCQTGSAVVPFRELNH
jgi:hypothetical protein